MLDNLCKLDNFLKNRTNKLLEDKLLPDFYHDFFWSEEIVHLNYFPIHNGVTVLVCPIILLGIKIILMADVKPFFLFYILAGVIAKLLWQILLPGLWQMLLP